MTFRIIDNQVTSADVYNALSNVVTGTFQISTDQGNRTIPLYASSTASKKLVGKATLSEFALFVPILDESGQQLRLPTGSLISVTTKIATAPPAFTATSAVLQLCVGKNPSTVGVDQAGTGIIGAVANSVLATATTPGAAITVGVPAWSLDLNPSAIVALFGTVGITTTNCFAYLYQSTLPTAGQTGAVDVTILIN